MFQSVYEFTLPKGYRDEAGNLHRDGEMRLARAKDELEAGNHPKARQNKDYQSFVVLSRVVTRLGTIDKVTPEIMEQLFISDMNFLQNMYMAVNEGEEPRMEVTCPHCQKRFEEPVNFTGQG